MDFDNMTAYDMAGAILQALHTGAKQGIAAEKVIQSALLNVPLDRRREVAGVFREFRPKSDDPRWQRLMEQLSGRFEAAAKPKMCAGKSCGNLAATTFYLKGFGADYCVPCARRLETNLRILRGEPEAVRQVVRECRVTEQGEDGQERELKRSP